MTRYAAALHGLDRHRHGRAGGNPRDRNDWGVTAVTDMTKRQALKLGGAAGMAGLGLAGGVTAARSAAAGGGLDGLVPMTDGVVPITLAERRARLDKARRLMGAAGIDVLFVEPGSSLVYFTGLKWGRSERMLAAVIPRDGDIAYVCPAFEETAVRERMVIDGGLHLWDEHEDPARTVAGIFGDFGLTEGTVGLEPTTRFFHIDGIRRAAPGMDYVNAAAVVTGCRVIKSPAEIALMQRAMDITVAAYKAVLPMLEAGMANTDVTALIRRAHAALGASGAWSLCQFGPPSALPHGSVRPQTLKPGDIVLMDSGGSVEGYQSDISRTVVFGEPSARQRQVWATAKAAQAAAFEAARPGVPCEAVDAAARAVIEAAGFGPGYRLPGLSHRTGHGIGMDGHEPVNFVRGEKTPLAPGMCLSNEPGIYIEGDFGVRLEDCLYMTADGPRWFSQPSPAIDAPFAAA